jgi:hypothetical protein
MVWQLGPSLGLVLVAPSGQRRPMPARLATIRFALSVRVPFVALTQERMTQAVNRINELAAGQRRPFAP